MQFEVACAGKTRVITKNLVSFRLMLFCEFCCSEYAFQDLSRPIEVWKIDFYIIQLNRPEKTSVSKQSSIQLPGAEAGSVPEPFTSLCHGRYMVSL